MGPAKPPRWLRRPRSIHMSTLLTEARVAFRVMLRSPGATVAAAVTLALGIAAATVFHAAAGAAAQPAVHPAAGGLLLAPACLSVAILVFGRTAARRHELTLRRALGASRMRLMRQLLTENVCLTTVAGALGLLLALWGLDAAPELIGAPVVPSLGWGSIVFALSCSAVAAALIGVPSALFGVAGTAASLSTSGAGPGERRHRGGNGRWLLITAHLVLSAVLAAVPALLNRIVESPVVLFGPGSSEVIGYAGFVILPATVALFGLVCHLARLRAGGDAVRVVLGAPQRVLLGSVMVVALAVTTVGLALGLVAGSWLSGADLTAGSSALLLAGPVAALAGYLPARRATLPEPTADLGTE